MSDVSSDSAHGNLTMGADLHRALRADLADLFKWFLKEYFGRGPSDVRVELLDKTALIITTGVLAGHERRLVESPKVRSGQRLLSEMREALFEIGRSTLQAKLVEILTNAEVEISHQLFPQRDEAVFLLRSESLTKGILEREEPRRPSCN